MKNLNLVKTKEGDNYFVRNKNYDELNINENNWFNSIKVNNLKPKKVLEIGCGAGHKLNYLSQQLNTKYNYGVDLSKKAILDGKKKYKKLKLLNISSLQIDKINTKFDLIICGFFLYLLDREEIFKQFDLIYKKLNKNGHLIIIDFNPTFKHTNRHSRNNKLRNFKMKYDNFLEESGLFKIIFKKNSKSYPFRKKFISNDEALTLFQKINFEDEFPKNC